MYDVLSEIGEMQQREKEMDLHLAVLAKQAIEQENYELQMLTVSQPFTGKETMRVFMKEAENPHNCVYGIRCAVAQDPSAGDCFLSLLAEVAIEFEDEELKKIIAKNPSAGVKTKEILGL